MGRLRASRSCGVGPRRRGVSCTIGTFCYAHLMSRLSASLARTQLPDAINQVAYGGERVVIHRRGKALAALISMEDLELLRQLEDKLDGEAALVAKKSKGTTSWEKVKAKAGLR